MSIHVPRIFTDIAGFSKWSSQQNPEQIFSFLQALFGTFDDIARKHKVLKIEAIGDCYVGVTGLVRSLSFDIANTGCSKALLSCDLTHCYVHVLFSLTSSQIMRFGW